jgi:hypothetical protein
VKAPDLFASLFSRLSPGGEPEVAEVTARAEHRASQVEVLGKADADQPASTPDDRNLISPAVTNVDEPPASRNNYVGRRHHACAEFGQVANSTFNGHRRVTEDEDPAEKGPWAADTTSLA